MSASRGVGGQRGVVVEAACFKETQGAEAMSKVVAAAGTLLAGHRCRV